MNLSEYQVGDFYDEMFERDGVPRPAAAPLATNIEALPEGELLRRQKAADQALMRMGITFNVYSDNQGVEKTFPFDVVPRIVSGEEWRRIDAGLRQRIQALNLFIDDIYHRRTILKDKVIPLEVVELSSGLRRQCMGLHPPKDIWIHITGPTW